MGKLTATRIRGLKEPGRYQDGQGLMLHVDKAGNRRWVLRIQHEGQRRDIGIGSASTVSLHDARWHAGELRKKIKTGVDPVAERKAERQKRKSGAKTFRNAAEELHAHLATRWSSEKHAKIWWNSLERHVLPKLGNRPVAEIDSRDVIDVLRDLWHVKPDTARRLRQRIAAILDWANVNGYRETEAPTRAVLKAWQVAGVKSQAQNFRALLWKDVPGFLLKLRETNHAGATVKAALEFLILTCVRSKELRLATWGEIDLERSVWTIPKARTKTKRNDHVVPLSEAALTVLDRAQKFRRRPGPDALVFEGAKDECPLADMTLLMPLRRMQVPCVVHGFRTSFRTWAAEATGAPREVAEACLAHVSGSAVERAYMRSDLLDQRRDLLATWGRFCVSAPHCNVVALARPAGQ
ncbi:MAG: integrase arm-type DNA-binding domain-containing protein [Pseudomonadota bacterium]|nr:integrase arm-type DNA-binding domain-containing protein [Pseudomonadota bacterium]